MLSVYSYYTFYSNVFFVSDTCKTRKHVLQIHVDTDKHKTRITKAYIRKNPCRFCVVSCRNCQVYDHYNKRWFVIIFLYFFSCFYIIGPHNSCIRIVFMFFFRIILYLRWYIDFNTFFYPSNFDTVSCCI